MNKSHYIRKSKKIKGVINPKYVAGDAKLFHAKKNDSQAVFGMTSKGPRKGYSLSILCIATPNNMPFPITACVHKSSAFATKILKKLLRDLPEETKFVLADSGYDFQMVYDAVERFDECGNVIRKAVVAPRKGRRETPERIRRMKFYNSTRGRKIFARRLPSVELAFARLVQQLNVRSCFFKGEKNNKTFFFASCVGVSGPCLHQH